MFTSIDEKIDLLFSLRQVFNEWQYNFNKSCLYFYGEYKFSFFAHFLGQKESHSERIQNDFFIKTSCFIAV
jgi:hypothetical protein